MQLFDTENIFVWIHGFDERSAREVTIHNDFKYVIMQVDSLKIPEIIICFIQEIETVQVFHPTDTNAYFEIFRIYEKMILLCLTDIDTS